MPGRIVDPCKRSVLVLRRYRGRWGERPLGASDASMTPLLLAFRFKCGSVFDAAGDGN